MHVPAPPAPCVPGGYDIWPVAQDDMKVVRQDAEPQNVDPELPGQELNPLFDPGFAMIVVAAAVGIVSAKKTASHAATHAMKSGDFRRIKQIAAYQPSHDVSSPNGRETGKLPKTNSTCTDV